MTQMLTVQTDFRDLEQMVQGLAGRVQTNYVILPTGEAVDEGEWAQFEIALHDGSAGLAGIGRCVTLVDNGDERQPHQRYDVVLDSLQFDAHEQQIFEHILAVHGVVPEQAEDVGEGEAEAAEDFQEAEGYEDVSDFTGPHTVESVEAEGEAERTATASSAEIEAALSNPEVLRPAPGGEANDVVPHAAQRSGGTGVAAGPYARGGAAHAISPSLAEEARDELSGERIAPTRSVNGAVFAYSSGIPIPDKPPRPELDPALRVTPAPRPGRVPGH